MSKKVKQNAIYKRNQYSKRPKEFKDGIFIAKEPLLFLKKIQEVMELNAGIIREGARLQNGLKTILDLKETFYSKDNILKELKIDDENLENVVSTLEVKSSLIVCEAIIRSALMRQESRGGHLGLIFQT